MSEIERMTITMPAEMAAVVKKRRGRRRLRIHK